MCHYVRLDCEASGLLTAALALRSARKLCGVMQLCGLGPAQARVSFEVQLKLKLESLNSKSTPLMLLQVLGRVLRHIFHP